MDLVNFGPDTLHTIMSLWVKDHIETVQNEFFYTDHIDLILGRKFKRKHWKQISLDVFDALIKVHKATNFPAKPILVFPLQSFIKQVSCIPPNNVEEVKSQLKLYEPPTIGLINWETPKGYMATQQYVTPLGFSMYGTPQPLIAESYREARYGTSNIESNDEFTRSVFLEYYPLGKIS